MRVGIIPNFNPHMGGAHQYSEMLLSQLLAVGSELPENEFVVLKKVTDRRFLPDLSRHSNWSTASLKPSFKEVAVDWVKEMVRQSPLGAVADRLVPRQWIVPRAAEVDHFIRLQRPEFGAWFRQNGISWLLMGTTHALGFESGLPYVMPVHDLMHRLHPEFPEVGDRQEWQYREYLYRNVAESAAMVLVDSEIGKEDMLNCYADYGIHEDRVAVLPFLPANYLSTSVAEAAREDIRCTYSLPERYIFAPAQFWPHKNHKRMVEALSILKQRRIEVNLVVVGSARGKLREQTYVEFMRTAVRLGVSGQIHNLGYVPSNHMSALYAEAVAMALPTFFGPTNIPILEAWAFGCPVLTSNLRGNREQAGDAAVLVDPASPESIAEGFRVLWEDEHLRTKLKALGAARLASYGPGEFRKRLLTIINTVSARIAS